MSYVSTATINAQAPPFYSKFTVLAEWLVDPSHPEAGAVQVVFNVNADIIVPKFWSGQRSLTFLYDGFTSGYQTFTGSIGGGRIYIQTDQNLIIYGPISGGPAAVQTFTGAGTWTQS